MVSGIFSTLEIFGTAMKIDGDLPCSLLYRSASVDFIPSFLVFVTLSSEA
jgi:hypothetical protein